MNENSKVMGFRKMGVAMGAISALVFKPPEDIKIAVIVGIVAVTQIVGQTLLDWKKKENS